MRSRKVIALVALAAGLLVGGLVLAAADGLILPALTGGGGRSESEGIVMQSAVGQAVVGRSDSGAAVLCAGWPGCRDVVVTPPCNGPAAVPLSIARSGQDVVLSWTHDPGNGRYEVRRQAGNPYYPVASGDLLAILIAPAGVYTDTAVLNQTADNDFYVLQSLCLPNDPVEATNRGGVFHYSLVPGTAQMP